MGHTNSTPNYALPQFVTTDKPAWLTDINGAFSAIDTGLDAAKDAADNAQSDATQALTDAGTAGTTATTANTKADGVIASIADTFSATDTYNTGDLVMYNNLLYICIADVTTPGAWTGATNWSRKTIEGVIDDVESDTATALSSKADIATTYTMNQIDGLLNNKLDSNFHVSTGSGSFPALVGVGQIWLIVAQRITTNATCMIIAQNSSGTMQVKEIVKDSGFAIVTNSIGTVNITYSNSGTGVYGGAYRLV